MSRTFAQRPAWWWPLVLAVFALSTFAAITLAAGTAHADGADPSSAGESRSEQSPEKAPEKSPEKSPDESPTAKVDGEKVDSEEVDSEKVDGEATESADVPKNRSTVRHTKTAVEEGAARDDDSEPTTEISLRTEASNVLDLAPRLAVKKATQVVAKTAEPTRSTPETAVAEPTEAPANIVALPTAAPSVVAATTAVAPYRPPTLEQFAQRVVGLLSDAGIVGASLVNNIALQVAAAIGPQPFWGVPYAVTNAVAKTAGNVSRVLSGTPIDATSSGPFPVDYGVLDVLSFFTPTKVPAGANDPSITVTAEHPLPVILVNGTVETQSLNWGVGAPVLANAGYKVYTFNYGNITPFPNYWIQSTADIRTSAVELSDEIDRVLAETGAAKVILVGHSQGGGILPAYYINEMDGAAKVSQLIGLAPSNHGTDFNGLVVLQKIPLFGPLLFGVADLFGRALGQQLVTSPFQQVVYGNGDTRPGVQYTTIASTHDEVVTPFTQQALVGPGVTNIVLQDLYPWLPTGHVGVAFSSQAWTSVLAALAANAEANPSQSEELAAA